MNTTKPISIAQVGAAAIVFALVAGVLFANFGVLTAWLSKSAALRKEPLYERSPARAKGDIDGMLFDAK